MSGNPFRQSQAFNASAVTPTAAPPSVSFLDADSSSADGTARAYDSGIASSSSSAKTKKSVRIEAPVFTSAPPHPTPLAAGDPVYQRLSLENAVLPLPTSPAGFSDNFEDQLPVDPFEKEHGRDRTHEVQGREKTNAPEGRNTETSVRPVSGAPINPFARTLASMEGSELSRGEREQGTGRSTGEKAGGGTPKANLDVESFKRLLLTGFSPHSSGKQNAQATVTAPAAAAASAFESSSTDTSVSRQSIVEPMLQEPHADTPRTSYEMAPSDEERVGLIADIKKSEKRKQPPPAPKHRHGKLVSPRTPQTVPFADFGPSEPTPAPIPRRTNSDLNKPLPPIPPASSPPAHVSSQDVTQDIIEPTRPPLQTRPSASSDTTNAATPQKRVPPPVPLSRRQSQLRTSTTGNRSRSSSILTMSSQHSVTDFPIMSPSINSEPRSSPSQKVPPPPPPTRRHGASLTGGVSSSANSSTIELPSSARRADTAAPNHPSSRKITALSNTSSPLPGQSGLARTPSTASTRNISRAVSGESTSSVAPPPPPPRRRQSGRSSLDKERPHYPTSISSTESPRTSSEVKRNSLDGKRRTSVASESSLRYEYTPSTEQEPVLYSPTVTEEPQTIDPITTSTSNTKDILHDMEEFQREIDELRQRYQKGS